MTYDFTSIMNRHGMDSIAVDGLGTDPGFAPDPPREGFDVIPMWVADMNFPTVPTIPQAIIERAKHPAYGYFSPTDDYYSSIIDWQSTRNGVTGLTREAIGYENGVLGGVISALTAFAAPGDGVLLHSPTYIGFTRSIENNGYRIVHSPLTLDERGVWRMDYEDMDRKLKEHHIHVAVFCSPHNPCGRVWERWEIEKAMEVYKANDCVVISDEIWSDLTLGNHQHIPTQSVSEDARNRTVAFYAPSKTFNLAGLVGSYHIIYNPTLRDRIVAKSSKCHYNDMNVLSMHALIGAYRPDMREVDDTAMTRAAIFVDSRATTIHHIGEIMAPIASGAITESDIRADFYDIKAGLYRRDSADQITIAKNGGGAHLDLMTADYIRRAWANR